MHIKLLVTAGIVLPLIAVLIGLATRVKQQENDTQINIALLILGGALGWLLGIFMSPYDSGETAAFASYASAVATFASGYLLAKIDPLVSKLFTPDFLFNRVVAFRTISFISMILLAMLMTFAVRVYLPAPETVAPTLSVATHEH